jgi:hypothetical protein
VIKTHNAEAGLVLDWLRLCGWQVKGKDGHRYFDCYRGRDTIFVRFLNTSTSTVECPGHKGVSGTMLTMTVGCAPHDYSSNGVIEILAALFP